MSIETIQLNQDNALPPAVLSQLGFEEKKPLKVVLSTMGVLLVKESASLSDIILTLEELKTLYANQLRELDKEWDDFTLSEELLSSDF
ncbi:MAG: hypothetical protein ACREOI_01915 [bacterium]